VLAPSSASSWLPSALRLPADSDVGSGPRPRPAIEYRDADEADGNDSVRAEVNRLNKDSNLASHVEGGRVRSTGLWREHENWRDGGEHA
jgi:hypothetical protein